MYLTFTTTHTCAPSFQEQYLPRPEQWERERKGAICACVDFPGTKCETRRVTQKKRGSPSQYRRVATGKAHWQKMEVRIVTVPGDEECGINWECDVLQSFYCSFSLSYQTSPLIPSRISALSQSRPRLLLPEEEDDELRFGTIFQSTKSAHHHRTVQSPGQSLSILSFSLSDDGSALLSFFHRLLDRPLSSILLLLSLSLLSLRSPGSDCLEVVVARGGTEPQPPKRSLGSGLGAHQRRRGGGGGGGQHTDLSVDGSNLGDCGITRSPQDCLGRFVHSPLFSAAVLNFMAPCCRLL